MFNKEKHLSCENCEMKCKVIFKNLFFCFGLVKKLYEPNDYYRYCIVKGDNKNCTEIMLEEVYAILNGLSSLLINKRHKDILKRKKK